MKKIKFISILLSVIFCVNFITACQKQQTEVKKEDYMINEPLVENAEKAIVLDVFPMNMIYSSGAGGWRTQITLKEDGTFVGDYYDSQLGLSGVDYDYTVYICEFYGKYEIVEQIDNYSYRLIFTEVISAKNKDAEWVEDGIKYICSEPFGVNKNTEYILYTDETPVKNLSEDALMWWPLRYNYQEDNIQKLSCYGLYNETDSVGFFSIE